MTINIRLLLRKVLRIDCNEHCTGIQSPATVAILFVTLYFFTSSHFASISYDFVFIYFPLVSSRHISFRFILFRLILFLFIQILPYLIFLFTIIACPFPSLLFPSSLIAPHTHIHIHTYTPLSPLLKNVYRIVSLSLAIFQMSKSVYIHIYIPNFNSLYSPSHLLSSYSSLSLSRLFSSISLPLSSSSPLFSFLHLCTSRMRERE